MRHERREGRDEGRTGRGIVEEEGEGEREKGREGERDER